MTREKYFKITLPKEICSNALVRKNKWVEHCKKFHAFKFPHGGSGTVKRKTVQYKNAGWKWLNYASTAET